jgi:hypothetical protein
MKGNAMFASATLGHRADHNCPALNERYCRLLQRGRKKGLTKRLD